MSTIDIGTGKPAKANGLARNNAGDKKQLILNAFAMNTPGHLSPGLWRHPRNKTYNYKKLDFWTDLAKILDEAGFHALFLADVLGAYDVYKGPANAGPALGSGAQFPINDPLYLVPAMAAVTKILHSESQLARQHQLDSAVRNFGLSQQVEHDTRYEIAEEYMEVLYKLWEGSWREDAVIADKQTGIYALGERVREINHRGKHFNVPGPHICEPSPQRTPYLFQAGTSKSGRAFGAKHAEVIFAGAQLPEKLKPWVEAICQLAKEAGRDPYHVKIIASMCVIVAETDEAAKQKHEEFLSYGSREGALALFGGWTGVDLSTYSDDEDFRFVKMPMINSIVNGWADTVPGSENLKWNKTRIAEYLLLGGMNAKVVGSPTTVANELERWVKIADVDGFNLSHVVNPGSFEDIIEFLLPELRARGIFREGVEKQGLTAREHFFGTPSLLSDHPGSKFKWDEHDDIPQYQQAR